MLQARRACMHRMYRLTTGMGKMTHALTVTCALDKTALTWPAVLRFRPWLPVPPTLSSALDHKLPLVSNGRS